MFRNVTGAQEAIVHRQSETSLLHEKNPIKFIKDIQSDDIAETYSTLQTQWFDQRERLIENLKNLEKHDAFPHEIQHVKNLIGCLNQLIENGEMTKSCQTLIDDMNKNIHLLPETYLLTRKPLGDKAIRLPRHVSNTKTHEAHPLRQLPPEIIHTHHENEKLPTQIDFNVQTEEKHVDSKFDTGEITTSEISTEKMKNGIQFYVIAEPFRSQTVKHTRKKRYLSSTIVE
ncbi:unnamed protein product [Rotaria socialis]|uniref:Uncharacterized protein n=1 Tax=Rotaria socialis TaxID=392032 RepID=A0A817M8D4_9BILA|nr:unnamed protein product [Rotaria socialis]CAF4482090.1 unnamed protein product [Rotaria socialis]